MQRTIDAGTKMCFGIPAVPMPEGQQQAIAKALGRVPEVREAFLPQCHIEGDDEFHQMLFVGLAEGVDVESTMGKLGREISGVFRADQFIDIFPYTMDEPFEVARIEECCIYAANQKSWWQFW